MNKTIYNRSFNRRFIVLVLSFGPGIFAIGYTIGTGSVTSMTVAGSGRLLATLIRLSLNHTKPGIRNRVRFTN